MVGYVREKTAKKSCQFAEHKLFGLFLFIHGIVMFTSDLLFDHSRSLVPEKANSSMLSTFSCTFFS